MRKLQGNLFTAIVTEDSKGPPGKTSCPEMKRVSTDEELESVSNARRARGPFSQEALVALEEHSWKSYSTSTVMLSVAVTGSWSFVAPVTVILRVPLLRPFSVPAKPF